MIIVNPCQLTEVETNFIAEQVQALVKKAKTMKEKEEIIFKFLNCLNESEATFFRDLYNSYDKEKIVDGVQLNMMEPESKASFIRDVEKNGFYIVRPPHKPIVFDDVIRLYDTFPEIKPKDLYVDIFGMKQRKIMRPGVIGYMYMIVLKQNSNKNFSARSTFRVNRSNLPAKDIAKKTNRSSYARTPVRLSEIYNILSSISDKTLAEFNIFMRSSALGRKSLDRIITASGNPLKLKKLKVQPNFNNANADILAARLKGIGLRINFSPYKDGKLQIMQKNKLVTMSFGDYMVCDYPDKRPMYADLFAKFKEIYSSKLWIEEYRGQRFEYIWNQVFKDENILKKYKGVLSDDLKERLILTTKGQLASRMKELSALTPGGIQGYVNATKKKRGRKSKTIVEETSVEEESDLDSENENEELNLYSDMDESDDTSEEDSF